jgi:diguanylate cyclase (GGDEF)-like protein/PAS domain S-box-containing protein
MTRRLESILRSEATAWVVLALSIVMTMMAWQVATRYLDRDAKRRFGQSSQFAQQRIQERMDDYQEILRTGAGLFASSEHVSRAEWHTFVENLKLRQVYPGIQGLGYVVMVPPGGKTALEERIRREGFPDFAIKPPGRREQYSAIVYIEPFDWRNKRALGYDMYSDPVRRAAMAEARDTGRIALSGHVTLVQETDRGVQSGCLMYLPIYRHGVVPATVQERRAALEGYVYGAFRMDDLMRAILGPESGKWPLFDLYDGDTRIYRSAVPVDAAGRDGLARQPRFRTEVPIEVAGRTWTARFSSSPEFEASVSSLQPSVIAVGGILADLLLFAGLLSISRGRMLLARRNEELAASREELIQEKGRYAALVENVPGIVFRCGVAPPWPVQFVSSRIGELCGVSAEEFMSGRRNFGEFVHREDLARVAAEISAALAEGRSYETEFRIGDEADGYRWLRAHGAVHLGPDGEPLWLEGVSFDVSERKQQLHVLEEREMRYRAVLETTPDGFWLADRDGRLVGANESYSRMSGYSLDELLKLTIPDLDANEQPEETAEHIAKVYELGHDRFETVHRRKDGSLWPAEITVSLLPALGDMFVFARDLTEIKALEAERLRSEERIRNLAFLDPLTQLPNRRLLSDRLKQALAAGRRNRRYGALLFIDMDNFKLLNDSLGHEMGDLLLQQVAGRLLACVRAEDTVARLGGDEFVVMLAGLSEEAEEGALLVGQVGEKILAALNQPYRLGSQTYQNTPSVGATLFQDDRESVDAILKRADAAMYQVKASGRNGLRFFDADMETLVSDKVLLEEALSAQTPDNELVLHYQPLLDREGVLLGVEALVRWQHPQRGLLLPAEFLTLAEDTGLIVRLGGRVLEMVCRRLTQWAGKPAMANLDVTVNVSIRQLRHPGFVAEVEAVLNDTGADPARLVFELSETLMTQGTGASLEVIQALKRLGIRFSLDNFGACYLTMGALLTQFPFDQLKLERTCLSPGQGESPATGLVQALIALADSLGPGAAAKGVETEAQWAFLRQEGCRQVQGYLFGHPVTAEELERLWGR